MLRRPIERHTLKPFIFPKGFILIQDSREQLPLFPSNEIPLGLQIENRCLINGDYLVKGIENLFAVERKANEIWQYIGKDRQKTVLKMERFRSIKDSGGFVGLVIESTLSDLMQGYYRSTISPETMRQTLCSFEVRYGIHIFYSRSKGEIANWVLDRAIKAYKLWGKEE